MTDIFLLLLLGHAVGDFYLQSDRMAGQKRRRPLVLALHSAVYTAAVTAAVLIGTGPAWRLLPWAGALLASHFLIDGLKVLPRGQGFLCRWDFFWDQGLHLLVLIGLTYWLRGAGVKGLTCPALLPDTLVKSLPATPLALAAAALLLMRPASCAVKNLLEQSGIRLPAPKDEKDLGFPNGGALIGMLERLVAAALILDGQTAVIAALVAAKALARFRALENRKCAEYYLIGTLLSLVAAGLCCGLTLL